MFASRFGPLLTTWMSRVKPETLAILGLLGEPLAPRRWDGRPDDERAPAVFPGGGDPGEGGRLSSSCAAGPRICRGFAGADRCDHIHRGMDGRRRGAVPAARPWAAVRGAGVVSSSAFEASDLP